MNINHTPIMKKTSFLFFFLFSISYSFAQHGNTAYNAYIENFHQIAIQQQNEHGIPASITLAQGLLESGAGKSMLAVKANNHFGIKCHDWTGAKIYYDDDKKNECFRKYKRVLDSYEDHSAFLKNRSRYASLFELQQTDYKGWAHGLKKAGYATDPTYAYKLISIIEEYELHRFDLIATKDQPKQKATAKKQNTKSKSKTKTKKEREKVITTTESKTEKNQNSIGTVNAFDAHYVMKVNGLKYIRAYQGDTFGSIADEFGVKESNLVAFNEVPANYKLKEGEFVYLQKKKRKAEKGFDTHAVQAGESMYSIAQFYGIRLIDLYDMNNMAYTDRAETGMVLKIRP